MLRSVLILELCIVLWENKYSVSFLLHFSGSNLKQRKPDYSVLQKQRLRPHKTKSNVTAQHVFTAFV